MRKYDLISGIFLLLVAVLICAFSLQMEIGKPSAPNSGFYPLLMGTILGLFSLIIIYQSRKQEKTPVRFWLPGANKKAILLAFAILVLYILLLEKIGFLLTTIIFFILVSRFVSGHNWKTAFIFSFTASLSTYLIFRFVLRAPLAQGIFEGFF